MPKILPKLALLTCKVLPSFEDPELTDEHELHVAQIKEEWDLVAACSAIKLWAGCSPMLLCP